METAQRQALTKCRVQLVKNLQVNEMFDVIQTHEIFTQLTLEDIKESNHSRADRVRALLDYLPRRGPEAFDKFILCLQETRNNTLAHSILQEYLTALGPDDVIPDHYQNILNVPFPVQATGQGHDEGQSVQETGETEMIVEGDEAVDSTNANYSGVQESSTSNRPPSRESSTSSTETNSSRPNSGTLFGATRPTVGYSGNIAEEYRMESEPRGYLLIIDNRKFTPPFSDREGSDVDCDSLEKLFQWLGYGVDKRLNLTGVEIHECLNSLSQFEALNHVDSLAVAILTHGADDRLFGVDGRYITVSDAVEHFTAEKCPALHHKPKLFIINACRGENEDRGSLAPHFSLNQSAITSDHNEDIPSLPYVPGEVVRISKLQDFLLAYSTIPGYVSWRHLHEGSWFIQALVKVFTDHAEKKDILTMLTKVNKIVSENITEQGVQIPAPQVMLTRTWYLNPPPQRER